MEKLLAEMAAEGGKRVEDPSDEGKVDERGADEVAASTEAMRRRVIGQAARGWLSTRDGIRHLRYSHEDCIDRIISQPGIQQQELAMLYGVTDAWMSIVMNCDLFKAKLAERRAELIDPELTATLNEHYGALARRSVMVLMEKLHQPIEKISDKLALEAASLGARATGMGTVQPPTGPNATDHLAGLANRLLDLNRPRPVIDVSSRQVDSPPTS